jgi:hypothetical protein
MVVKRYTLPAYDDVNALMTNVHLSHSMLHASKMILTDGDHVWVFFSSLDEFIRSFPSVQARKLGKVNDHSQTLLLDLLEVKFIGSDSLLGNLFVTCKEDRSKEFLPFVCLEYLYEWIPQNLIDQISCTENNNTLNKITV